MNRIITGVLISSAAAGSLFLVYSSDNPMEMKPTTSTEAMRSRYRRSGGKDPIPATQKPQMTHPKRILDWP
jgi:hypothetical protein